ncbi:hypothetical protein OR1_00361 [Geobacter sp. OR-1]|uniref:DUF2156 domain-containing protein n=1 Tax=Geobacter sp. OR-1 TaxID=1266765 RepID=UPI000543C9C8|nr:DUF2156 domain-containing protein [Geobacter sp. OR-1]GAM08090.1 hypothetical protein OR1_00361 [Geobacter sp. OR-1]
MDSNLLPKFPDRRPIALDDKPLLDRIFADLQPAVSELTFAGLYLFRQAHDYRLSLVNDSLVVLGKGYDGEDRFLPPLTGDIPGALRVLFASGLTLYGADDDFAEHYLNDEKLTVLEDRDAFDYLYLRRDLAELPGNRYHKKKNRINYFSSRHDHAVELFAERHATGCLDLLEEWLRVRGGEVPASALLEVEATAEGIKMAANLGLEGVVVLVDGAVRAFALGEQLNATTSVCHFEKGDPFMEGVSPLVDREFNRVLFTGCSHVNREQDLGEPGLRGAKLSYHPVGFVKKYRACLENVCKMP